MKDTIRVKSSRWRLTPEDIVKYRQMFLWFCEEFLDNEEEEEEVIDYKERMTEMSRHLEEDEIGD